MTWEWKMSALDQDIAEKAHVLGVIIISAGFSCTAAGIKLKQQKNQMKCVGRKYLSWR